MAEDWSMQIQMVSLKFLQQSSEWLEPVPYKAYPNQQCTEEGLKEV